MSRDVVVVGVGGFGRVVLDVVDAVNRSGSERLRVVGALDDCPSEENLQLIARRGVPYLGTTDEWLVRGDTGPRYLIGIGHPATRRTIAERFDRAGFKTTTLVHPTVAMGFDIQIEAGGIVCAGVVMENHIRVGRLAHLNMAATVGHDSIIGSYVSLNPAVSISGNCVIEDEVLVGVGAVVLQGRTIGTGARVGAAACVVHDVPPGKTVTGVPARPHESATASQHISPGHRPAVPRGSS